MPRWTTVDRLISFGHSETLPTELVSFICFVAEHGWEGYTPKQRDVIVRFIDEYVDWRKAQSRG